MRRISIFGATGSIGESTVDILRHQGGADAFRVVALTGGRNVVRLAQMARALRAEIAVSRREGEAATGWLVEAQHQTAAGRAGRTPRRAGQVR